VTGKLACHKPQQPACLVPPPPPATACGQRTRRDSSCQRRTQQTLSVAGWSVLLSLAAASAPDDSCGAVAAMVAELWLQCSLSL
jgi:hypothetical protein